MRSKLAVAGLVLALVFPTQTLAQTQSQVVNGATCIPYPPFDASNAVPYQHFLFGLRQGAFCHFTMSNTRRVTDLAYVVLVGSVSSGTEPMRIRLCVYSASGFAHTCGFERTITSGGFGLAVVPAPNTLPSSPMGAYLNVRFPANISTVQNFLPVWIP